MYGAFKGFLQEKIDKIREEGLYKEERAINSRQGVKIKTADGREVLNFCANNYLGLAGDKRISDAAKVALDKWGYGMSSVRFICGTQTIPKELEGRWPSSWALRTSYCTRRPSTPTAASSSPVRRPVRHNI